LIRSVPVRRGKSDGDVAEDAEPLAVLDLDDPEIGIRPEDRFAAIPPGPRLVPRRMHGESTRAPVVLLAGLLALFIIGSWLGGVGSDDEVDTEPTATPVLDQITETKLLLVGDEGIAEIDVGRGAARPVDDGASYAIRLRRHLEPRSRIIPSATAGRAWVVSRDTDGVSSTREIDLGDGATTAKLSVEGRVVAAATDALVVERSAGLIEAVRFDGTTLPTVAPSGRVLGAAGTLVATRAVEGCADRNCGIVVTDIATGTTRDLPAPLSAGGTEFGSMAPDGRLLAVLRSDGVETHGVLLHTELGTTTPFRARNVGRDTIGPTALSWSADGAWLLIATEFGGLDAVATVDGTTYRVVADLPPFTAIVAR
jgi:hypothetical protein